VELKLPGRSPLSQAAFFSFEESGSDCLIIDAQKLEFACPLDLAGMVAMGHDAAGAALPVTLRLPVDPGVSAYLERMDVVRRMPPRTRIEGPLRQGDRRNRSDALLEVTPLNAANADDLSERLGELVMAYYSDYSTAAGVTVFQACGELIDNAVTHSGSSRGAFVAAQTYTGGTTDGPRFEFAICDNGIGVMQHLKRNPKHAHLTRDELALKLAIQAGVSGVTAKQTADARGNGLSDLVAETRKHGQINFQLRSGRGEIRVVGGPNSLSQTPSSRNDQTSGSWAWLSHRIPVESKTVVQSGK
jgi:hypothetical protein